MTSLNELATKIDAAVLAAMTITNPRLVRTLRILIELAATNEEVLRHCCDAGATPFLLRNIAHSLDAIRRERSGTFDTPPNL